LSQNLNIAAAVVSTQNVRFRTSGKTTYAEAGSNTSFGTQRAKAIACRKGAIDLVMQIAPTVQFNKVPEKTGYNILAYDLYGVKTFDE
jgi:hypothetical protein